jgi:hypothetical protein
MKKEVGPISRRYGSGDPDHQNVTDPKHFLFRKNIVTVRLSKCDVRVLVRIYRNSLYFPVLWIRIDLALLDPDPYWECGFRIQEQGN